MDLLAIQPQKVSTDMSSYTTFIYGPPKAGKTTFMWDLYGTDAIFARTEKGTKAIPGLFGQDIANWSDFMKFIQQLRKPAVKEKFKVVVVDTIDNLYLYLEKYLLNKYGVDKLAAANGGYGAGQKELSASMFDAFKRIEAEGYSIAFISHAKKITETLPGTETEYTKYIPSVPERGLEIATKMVDNLLFSYLGVNPETKEETRVLYTRETMSFQAGVRFKNMNSKLPMSAEAFKEDMTRAINELGPENLKTEAESNMVQETELDFDALLAEAKEIVGKLHKDKRMPEVTEIVEKYLGPGQLLTKATKGQAETVAVIVEELKAL